MSGRRWDEAVYEAAKAAGWNSSQAAGATFAQVKTAAGITGLTPAAFFYVAIRHRVARRLRRENQEAKRVQVMAVVKAKIRELADFLDVELEWGESPETGTRIIIIKSAKVAEAGED